MEIASHAIAPQKRNVESTTRQDIVGADTAAAQLQDLQAQCARTQDMCLGGGHCACWEHGLCFTTGTSLLAGIALFWHVMQFVNELYDG